MHPVSKWQGWKQIHLLWLCQATWIGTEIAKNSSNENEEWAIELTIYALKKEAKDTDEESGVEDDSD